MGSHSLPSPPAEEQKGSLSRKGPAPNAKSLKPMPRVSKRTSASSVHHHDHLTGGPSMDGRHKRVWKACERCRMKKTKCDGEFPCKRCKDDGLICQPGARKKVEYKQLPRGYAEVLEATQFALIATVHKLYAMVRNNESWVLDEPERNDRNQPVIHDIATKLGCIRPNSDIDLPVPSAFPETEADLKRLIRDLDEKNMEVDERQQQSSPPQQAKTETASSSELDQTEFDQDYRKVAFGGGSSSNSNSMTLSPQSFTTSNDFDLGPPPPEMDPNTPVYYNPQASGLGFQGWPLLPGTQPSDLMRFIQPSDPAQLSMLNQSTLEGFGMMKGHSPYANPNVMLSGGGDPDPMIYPGFEDGQML